jgi:hypothetical protein
MNMSRRDQDGVALIVVVISMMVLSLLTAAVVSYATGSEKISRHDQDWNAALSAAEAGIDDYIFRLNDNDIYYTYGNPGAPAPNTAPAPPDGNKAFTQYVPVTGGSSDATYRYDVDRSKLNTTGRLTISSTGRVGKTERTVTATVRRRSFLDYLYFTDYETRDPDAYTGSPFSKSEANTRCAFHYDGPVGNRRDVNGRVDYSGDSDSTGKYCTDINFTSGDVIKGPLHSNDAILVCGSPSFLGHTTTAFTGEGSPLKRYRVNSSCSGSPSFAGDDPDYATDILMPPTNKALKNETVNVTGNQGGCLYTGPTRIRLESDGTMTVKSPYSRQTNNACPTNGNGALPKNGVIYVQNVISSPSSDANYWNPSTACPNSQYDSTTKTWKSASGSYSSPAHPLGYPITIGSETDQNSDYDCRAGDAFVEGTLDGQLTIAAENNIDVIRNLTYKAGVGGDDLLGLIADQYVEIYHPVSCTSVSSSCEMDADVPSRARFNGSSFSPSSEPSSSWNRPVFADATVNAAILSLQHSFRVQQYNSGDKDQLGDLHVVGAIAQKYRGAVGTINSTGYLKDYVYDNRLQYLSPPKFLDPVKVSWGVATWAEVKTPTAYK